MANIKSFNLPYIDTSKFNVVDVVRVKTDKFYGTLSKVFINDQFSCYGLEPFDRGFDSLTDLSYIKFVKSDSLNSILPGSRYCAIPIGVYNLDLHHYNPKYKKHFGYSPFNGECPQVLNVPGFSGINIHIGNYVKDTRGCLLLGDFHIRKNGGFNLFYSTPAFQSFFKIIRKFRYPTKIRYSRLYVCES